MNNRTLARTRGELSDFLRQRRLRLTPAEVGLPTTGRRRTPGLRREEVAALAGVGLTWYTWFEQGRDIRVSEAFLLNVAKALRLDDLECGHLFLLAHQRPPPTEVHEIVSISPLVQILMGDLPRRPAYVINLRWDVHAWNDASDALFGFSHRASSDRNLMRMVFTDPDLKRRLSNWKQDAAGLVAQFRRDLAGAPDHPAMQELVQELKVRSPDFRRWFEQSSTEICSRGIGTIADDTGRQLSFSHEALTVDEHRHLKMIVYFKNEA